MWIPGASRSIPTDPKWNEMSSNWSGREPRRGVRARGVERDVAEVEQARVADDDVEPEGHHREHEHHDGDPDSGKRQSARSPTVEGIEEAERDHPARKRPAFDRLGQPAPRLASLAPPARPLGGRLEQLAGPVTRHPLGRPLAEDPLGPEHEHRDQDPEHDRAGPVGARRDHGESLVEGLDEADHERADDGAGEVADPAEHGSGERDQPELEPLVEADRRELET